jgi:hypothetical protein
MIMASQSEKRCWTDTILSVVLPDWILLHFNHPDDGSSRCCETYQTGRCHTPEHSLKPDKDNDSKWIHITVDLMNVERFLANSPKKRTAALVGNTYVAELHDRTTAFTSLPATSCLHAQSDVSQVTKNPQLSVTNAELLDQLHSRQSLRTDTLLGICPERLGKTMKSLSVESLSRPRFELNKMDTLAIVYPEDRGSRFPRNVGVYWWITQSYTPDVSNRHTKRLQKLKISLVRIWNTMFLGRSVDLLHEGRDVEQGMRQEAGTLRSTGGVQRLCTSVRPVLDTQPLQSMVFWNRNVIWCVVTDVSEE